MLDMEAASTKEVLRIHYGSKKYQTPGHVVITFTAEGSVARMEEEMEIKLCATEKRELQYSTSK